MAAEVSTQFWNARILKVELEIHPPDKNSFSEILVDGSYTIGRSSTNDIIIKDERVSRKHARVVLSRSELRVFDDGSANGVVVNGHKQQEALLINGDEILLGITMIRVNIHEERRDADSGTTPIEAEPDKEGITPTELLGKKAARKKAAYAAPADDQKKRLRIILLVLVLVVGGFVGVVAWQKTAGKPAGHVRPASKQTNSVIDQRNARPNTPSVKPAPPAAKDDWRKTVGERFFEKGETYYQSDRLIDAIAMWEKSLQAYPDNQVAVKKLEIARAKLNQKAEVAFSQGMRNYHNLNYREAIENWKFVVNLVPDKNSELVLKAKKHIALVEKKLGESR